MRAALALPLIFALSLPAAADERLRVALARLPAGAAEATGAFLAGYIVPPEASGADPRGLAMWPMGRGVEGLAADPAAWSDENGLPSGAVQWVLAWGDPDTLVTAVGLSPDGMAALPAARDAAGFSRIDNGLWQNADPREVDFMARSRAGLWRDHLGRGAILAEDADGVRVAGDAARLAPSDPSPRVGMLLAGLDAVAGGAEVRQAALLGMEAGVQPDLEGVLLDPEAAMEKALAAPEGGLPVWVAAMLADVGDGVVQVTLHGDCAAAEAALTVAAALWAEAGDAPGQGVPVPVEGGCVAALRIDGAAYGRVLNAVAARRFPPLRMAGG